MQGKCEVYLDGGVRRGTDVFKALALGARAVFIGRPMVYGLAYDVSLIPKAYCSMLTCNFLFFRAKKVLQKFFKFCAKSLVKLWAWLDVLGLRTSNEIWSWLGVVLLWPNYKFICRKSK